MLNVVLVAPEIPQNTGNIARTCAATRLRAASHPAAGLRYLRAGRAPRRAGLLASGRCARIRRSRGLLCEKHRCPAAAVLYKAPRSYCDVSYDDGCYLFFGRETKGLPEPFLEAHYDDCVRIPIREEARSLNLSNSVAIGVFEALRQLNFPHLRDYGKMKV